MGLSIISLASGSKANCILVRYKNTNLLLDEGLNYNELKRRFYESGVSCDLDGILITHEHGDHVKGLPTMASKTDVPMFMHPSTFGVLCSKIGGVNYVPIENYESGFSVKEVWVQPFRISHDAEHPLGYSLYCGDDVVTLMTDTGYVSEGMGKRLLESSIIMIESNHDVEMLKKGNYPELLKRRILSKQGHLSNADCADALTKICLRNPDLKKIALMHLSENNNLPLLAYNAAKAACEQGDRADLDPIVALQRTPITII